MGHSVLILQVRSLAGVGAPTCGWMATARFDEFGGPLGTGSDAILRFPAESGLAPVLAMIHFEHGQYRLRNKGPGDFWCNGERMVPGKNRLLEHGDFIALPGFEMDVLVQSEPGDAVATPGETAAWAGITGVSEHVSDHEDDGVDTGRASVDLPAASRRRGFTRSKPPELAGVDTVQPWPEAPAAMPPGMEPESAAETAPGAVPDAAFAGEMADTASAASLPHVTEAVLLGVSTPVSAQAGDSFIAQVAAYIASQAQQVEALMREVGGDSQAVQMGHAPDGPARWQMDAPVRVEVSGLGLLIEGDAYDDFRWNGSQHISEFLVTVDPSFKGKKAFLKVTVLLAALPVAKMMAQIALGPQLGVQPQGQPVGGAASVALPLISSPASSLTPSVQTLTAAPVRKVFASHSSKDKARVLDMLNALTSIDRGLQVFTDCLDLVTQESFKPQLQREIEAADGFYLFWSVNSAASPWVQWEIDTARQQPGVDAMMLIPLDPPMLAPPPPGLEDRHLDSRYALARDAILARQARRAELEQARARA